MSHTSRAPAFFTAHEAPAHAAYCAEILFALLARAAARPLGLYPETATTTARLLADHVGL